MFKKEVIMIAEKIKMLRNANNMTQAELARKLWIYQCAESACPVFWKSPVRKEEIMVSDR